MKNKNRGQNREIKGIEGIKKFSLLFIILFLLALSANLVGAMGIAPARIVVDYEQGMHKEINIRILNPDHEQFRILVFAQGELAQYVKIPQQIYEVMPEGDKIISYTVDIPDKIETPGTHEAQITVVELPKTDESNVVISETAESVYLVQQISTKKSMISQFRINVPYPGKYAEAQLFVSEANKDEKAYFTVSLFNLGKEAIQKAKAKITILSPTNLEIAALETNEITLPANEKGKVTAEWKAAVNPGPYHAIVVVDYDDKKIRLEQNFNVGNMMIEIKKIEVSKFTLGDIAKFNIHLESKWAATIEDVYGTMQIKDKDGSILTNFKTAAIDLHALSVEKIEGYWDTKGVEIGTYDAELTVYYAGKTTKKMIETTVNLDSIQTSLTPTALAVEKTAGQEGTAKRDIILIAAVIILIAINIGWFIYIKKIKNRNI